MWVLPYVPDVAALEPLREVLLQLLGRFAVEVRELHTQVLVGEGSPQDLGGYVSSH